MPAPFLHGIETIELSTGARPVQTVKSAVIGLIGTAPDAVPATWPLNEPQLIVGGPNQVTDLGANGTLQDAFDGIFDQGIRATIVAVRVDEGVDIDATLTNVVGSGAGFTGVHAFSKARSEFGVTPRLLIAPGYTSQRPSAAANPVVAELSGIADTLRAMIIADGPDTTKEDAWAYRQDWGSSRIFIVDPHVKVFKNAATVIEPASARVAGLAAKVDETEGFWVSPSNHEIKGITGTSRPVDWYLSDPNTEANYLNEKEVATIIRAEGFHLWGNRTCSTDPLWAFFSVRRTADMITESMEEAHRWALDKPFSSQLLVDVAESVNEYLRILQARGATLGGRVWLDPDLNTATELAAGKVYFSYDAEPPAPMEHIVFMFARNGDYYKEMTAQAAREIARLAA
ncbi:MAG: phage tail sheath subtilisin-like domain-containing protein [Alphaproteobacteria bacterium]